MKVGLAAGVRLTAYKQRATPELNGEIVYIAADVTKDERTGQSYFITRTEVSEEELARLEGARVRPGMSADVFIRRRVAHCFPDFVGIYFDRDDVVLPEINISSDIE